MARQQKLKKSRAHVAAAHSHAGDRAKLSKSKSSSSSAAAAAQLGAAAVAATFGAEDDDDDAQPVDNEQSGDEDGDGDASALSRGQRKRQKRRAAFLKKMGLVQRVTQEAAKATKHAEQGVFADLEALQASLFEPDVASKKPSKQAAATGADGLQKKKMSGKQRQRLAVRELVHLKAVHAHSSFQGNAFAAIQLHLQNTVVQANQANLKKTTTTTKKATGSMDTD